MVCDKVHRVLEFNQKDFIKPFIEMCTEERRNARNDFDKSLFKKISNSIYGKTIENIRDRVEVKLHKTESGLQKSLNKHDYKRFSIIDDNLVATTHRISKVHHDKPYPVGFTILEYVSIKII
jgi:hypothetical protein